MLEEEGGGGGLGAGVRRFECRAIATSMLMRWTWKNIDLEQRQTERSAVRQGKGHFSFFLVGQGRERHIVGERETLWERDTHIV